MVHRIPRRTNDTMAVGRLRVMLMYLLAVIWCCADTPLVVRALLPVSSVSSHGAEPAVSISGERAMDALRAVISPNHPLSSPDRLNQPETSIRVDPMTISHPLADSEITGEVCPSNSPKRPRMKDRDEERREERNEEVEKGSSLGGGHESVGIDVKESEGTDSPDVEDNCAVCLDNMQDKATLTSWDECGHQFHTACIHESLLNCPLCRHPRTSGMPTPVPPNNSLALVIPDNYPHAFIFPHQNPGPPAVYYESFFLPHTFNHRWCQVTYDALIALLWVSLALAMTKMLINAFCHRCF